MGIQINEHKKISTIISILTGFTIILFLYSYLPLGNEISKMLTTRIISIVYLIGFISILILRRAFPKKEEPKKKILKKFTASNYGKIYHRRDCRFADSIMDKYFEESNDLKFFKNKKYKACGLCKPGKHEDPETNENITTKKKIAMVSK